MKNRLVGLLVFALVAFNLYAQSDQSKKGLLTFTGTRIISFDPMREMPKMAWYSENQDIRVDEEVLFNNQSSLLIPSVRGKKTEAYFGMNNRDITGKTIVFKGKYKYQQANNAKVSFAIKLDTHLQRIDEKAIGLECNGSQGWKDFCVEMPFTRSKKFFFRILCDGEARLWVNDCQVLIDGQSLDLIKNPDVEVDKDLEFAGNSGISLGDVDGQTLENLVVLGKVWGFLKYFHPQVVVGKYNWDFELFRVMPGIAAAKSKKERNSLLNEWIDKYGKITETEEYVIGDSAQYHRFAQLGWLEDPNVFDKKLSEKLVRIKNAKHEAALPMKYEIDYVRVYQKEKGIASGKVWRDTDGNVINAHGGGILFHEGKYYWFGEHRPASGFVTEKGINCYSSTDLYNWKSEGIALAVSEEEGHDIEKGCIMERPKVIYNAKTGKFVMWLHLELKGQGYGPARAAVAVSDSPTGPYRFIRSGRVNPGAYPLNMTRKERKMKWNPEEYKEWWTPKWYEAIAKGMFVKRDLKDGQMSRDMTLFVDDDGKAYHIYSSEDNLTLQIAELADDYLSHTGKYIRIFPGGHNEAPAIFKKEGTYWMITSGCTGWDPNKARLLTADSMLGEWKQLPNPCVGEDADKTFGGQSTYILPLPEKGQFVFMADMWRPKSLADSRYIWLPVQFDDKGVPFIKWMDRWNFD